MSAAARLSTHERRAHGGSLDTSERSRPRMSGAGGSFKTDRSAPSPQPGIGNGNSSFFSGAAGTAHKRSASGNPRPLSRATEERERVVERRTEKTFVNQME